MEVEKTNLEGVLIFKPQVFEDERGFFMETFRKSVFTDNDIEIDFIQENHSKSSNNVLRGLHYQVNPNAQAKLVRCISGAIYDVAVDIRFGSPTFGEYFGIELSAENKLQLFIPEGFAHGFYTLQDDTEVIYKVNNYYSKQDERGIIWNDTDINISWPSSDPIISDKDKNNLNLSEIKKDFSI